MSIDPRNLETLRTVLRYGSFAAAARHLGYTASAISQQMSALERSLNIRLFQRRAKSIVPTEAAEYLLQRSGELFELIRQIDLDIGRLGAGQAGRLRIGTFHSAGGALLGNAISRFLVRRREVEITLDEGEPGELFPRVADGLLDIALGFEYNLIPTSFPEPLRLEDVMSEGLQLIAPVRHRLAGRPDVRLLELRSEKWASHTPSTPAHQCLQKLTAQAGFSPDIAFHSDNPSTILGLVEAGLAVALVPRILLRERHPSLTVLRVADPLPSRRIIAAMRASESSPLADAFLTALRQSVAASLE